MNVFLSFKNVIVGCEDKHLDLDVIRRECGQDIDRLCSLFSISETQCLLLAGILELDAYHGCDIADLAHGFQCRTVEIHMLMDDIEALISKGYVYRYAADKFRIKPVALKAFRENRALDQKELANGGNKQKEPSPFGMAFDGDFADETLLLTVGKKPEKQLLLNADEESQYRELTGLLQKDTYKAVRRRLKEAGIKSGFTCLFYGAPGTGKTEAVYQLANATGRSVYQADMSQIHDKYVGGSEKNVSQLFSQYFARLIQSKTAPILLLNEADAIIARRLEHADTSVGQMYNRVQNIILQALEDFQGILVATTNLETNFDPAFERRFLFKLHFSHPGADVRARLWQSIVPALSADDCRTLADEFPSFAGGQIVNVGRKVVIDAALHGTTPTLQRLREFCLRETLAPQKPNMGFRIPA